MLIIAFGLSAQGNAATIQFNRDIRPILSDKCFSCHGPGVQEADLRLDSFERAARPGDNGPAITAHNPDKSLLIER